MNNNQNYQNMYQQPQQPQFQQQIPMKPCKHCKQMIQVNATVCPYCKKKQKSSGCLIAFIVIAIIWLLIGCFLFFVIIGLAVTKNESNTSSTTLEESSVIETIDITEAESKPIETEIESGNSNEKLYEVTDTTFHYYQNSIGSYEYYGIVEITNTSDKNLYLDSCVFDLEDDNGHLLQSDNWISNCPSIIKPGEKGYFYNNIGSTYIDENVSFDNGVNLVPNFKVEPAYESAEIVDYDVSDTEMREDDYGYTKITGRVTNNTSEDDSMCYVEFIFRDASGKVLFIFGTNVMDLTAGSTRSFDASAMFSDDSIKKEDIASYEVIARKYYYQF